MISDISATAFYKAQPVMDFAMEYLSMRDSSRLSDQDRLKVSMVVEFCFCNIFSVYLTAASFLHFIAEESP
jgi:hypothetical protein